MTARYVETISDDKITLLVQMFLEMQMEHTQQGICPSPHTCPIDLALVAFEDLRSMRSYLRQLRQILRMSNDCIRLSSQLLTKHKISTPTSERWMATYDEAFRKFVL